MEWRCINCKAVIESPSEPDKCPECAQRHFVKIDTLHHPFAGTTFETRAERAARTRPTPDGEIGELVEELNFAVRELTEVPAPEKNEVESLTGLSFGAIADYTQRAATALETQAADIARLREAIIYAVETTEDDHTRRKLSAALATRTDVR